MTKSRTRTAWLANNWLSLSLSSSQKSKYHYRDHCWATIKLTWNMTGRRFVARSRTRTAWCLPGDPSLERRESMVGGREESGSREG